MSIPIERLRRALSVDEPDYAALARLGSGIVPQLLKLVTSRDSYVAANAASLAGMIPGQASFRVLHSAARSALPQVRIAAAGALRRTASPQRANLLAPLLSDKDKGVRKFAIAAAGRRPVGRVAAELNEISIGDPEPTLRAMAASALRRTHG